MTREELLQISKPVLFNTEMVRAILDDRKGATRRVVKGFISDDAMWGYTEFTPKGYISCRETFSVGYGEKFFRLPCQKGDILYVRETWSPVFVVPRRYLYKVGCKEAENLPIKWHPSIHMPKKAARIFLKVKDVRVERLQEMSDDDCEKEGLENFCKKCHALFSNCDTCLNDEGIREDFKELWNSTIKKSDSDRYGWNANPWVWVIEFERIEVDP